MELWWLMLLADIFRRQNVKSSVYVAVSPSHGVLPPLKWCKKNCPKHGPRNGLKNSPVHILPYAKLFSGQVSSFNALIQLPFIQ